MPTRKTSKRSLPAPHVSAGRVYRGPDLLQIAMPMGGLGAGCVCLNGYGGLQDFSLRNRPALSAAPDGHSSCETAFALLHIQGADPQTRLVEGPLPPEKIYDQGLKAQGYRGGGHEGLPRFPQGAFTNEFPFGKVELSDPQFPVGVTVTGFSPFIPLDDKNSGLPCAILEYTIRNTSRRKVAFELSFHLGNIAQGKGGQKLTRNALLPGLGAHVYNTEDPNDETFGGVALGVIGPKPRIKAMWFRGGWFDAIAVLWREASTGKFTANSGNTSRDIDGHNGASVLVGGTLRPGQAATIPVVIAWYFPNSNQTQGAVTKPDCGCTPGSGGTTGGGGCAPEAAQPKWRPYYAGQWPDAAAVARYVQKNYAKLRERTAGFRAALASSTVPAEVFDAVVSNLAILKSPTILRQENGNLWGWEGCFAAAGCCHGSCTHVWNYAQAIPHLFPALERTLRAQELERSMDERGHVSFRAALPDGPAYHDFHPAADGQLGGIMKLYRDWQVSGDDAWAKRLYPKAKLSLDFCIARWDPQHFGALFEPHHNTYDIEFWGPDGMCTSVYAGALTAMAQLARGLGHEADAPFYEDLAGKSARFLDEELFNGEYFQQKVQWRDLRDQSFAQMIAKPNPAGDEVLRLLKKEGPKYQYGSGCLADGVIGAWMAQACGGGTTQSAGNVRKHLRALYRHNFQRDLFRHACTQRAGYALGHEPGLVLCTWPRGGKPTLPFVYSDEVWTGIEYQVAAHMIGEGLVKEGLALVGAARSRYAGHVRNPFNEYECGSYYARAMASYALLGALSGFRYSAVSKTLWFGPRIGRRPFRSFFSTAGGFGVVTLDRRGLTVAVTEGRLRIAELRLRTSSGLRTLTWKADIRGGGSARVAL